MPGTKLNEVNSPGSYWREGGGERERKSGSTKGGTCAARVVLALSWHFPHARNSSSTARVYRAQGQRGWWGKGRGREGARGGVK
eukprot:scaffold189_cov118-Isochrysis_galbana.AAC.1